MVVAFAPLSYFQNYKIIQNQHDATVAAVRELRCTVALEWEHPLYPKFFLLTRSGLEYRLLEGNANDILRFRNRLAVKYQCNSKLAVSSGDELFIALTGVGSQDHFDQNRLFCTFSYYLQPQLKFDIGYLRIARKIKKESDLLDENTIFCNVTYHFKNKKRTS